MKIRARERDEQKQLPHSLWDCKEQTDVWTPAEHGKNTNQNLQWSRVKTASNLIHRVCEERIDDAG